MPLKTQSAPDCCAPYNWTGFYIGAHLGAGWARTEWKDAGTDNAIGVLGGFQGGFNFQVTPWLVLGIEGQYSFAGLKGDHEVSNSLNLGLDANSVFIRDFHGRLFTKVDSVATLAGRVGIAAGDRTLFFAKGGAAWARDKFREEVEVSQLTTSATGNTDLQNTFVGQRSQTRT